jgi:hypothetical protein
LVEANTSSPDPLPSSKYGSNIRTSRPTEKSCQWGVGAISLGLPVECEDIECEEQFEDIGNELKMDAADEENKLDDDEGLRDSREDLVATPPPGTQWADDWHSYCWIVSLTLRLGTEKDGGATN